MSKKIRKAILVFLAAVLCCFTAASAGTVTLPAAVTAIPAEAFYGDTSLEKVVIPAKVTSIGSKAFANSSVEVVEFLGSGSVKITGDAFDGSGLAAVFAPEGSPAYKWAVAQGYSGNPKTVYRALVIGIMPARTGRVIPASRMRYRKLYRTALSKNSWVVRKSQPASTFSFR